MVSSHVSIETDRRGGGSRQRFLILVRAETITLTDQSMDRKFICNKFENESFKAFYKQKYQLLLLFVLYDS